MTVSFGPNLNLLVNANNGEGHDTALRQFLRGVDALVMPGVKDKDLATPPGSPSDGARYIVAASPTGAWAGHAGEITRYSSVATAWEFYAPKEGWVVWVDDEDAEYRHDGSAWKFSRGAGTDANRPASGLVGAVYFSTTTSKPNWYTGSGWVDAPGQAHTSTATSGTVTLPTGTTSFVHNAASLAASLTIDATGVLQGYPCTVYSTLGVTALTITGGAVIRGSMASVSADGSFTITRAGADLIVQ